MRDHGSARRLCLATLWLAACSHASPSPSAADSGDAGVALPALGSAGCKLARSLYAPGTTADELEHGGSTRTFRVHVPAAYRGDRPSPLLLMLHGGGGSGRQFEEASAQMDPIAEREGFVTVYPDGTGVLAGKTILAVGGGYLHSLALCSDGTLAAWGYNVYGQLGNNSSVPGSVPVAVDRSDAPKPPVTVSSTPYAKP